LIKHVTLLISFLLFLPQPGLSQISVGSLSQQSLSISQGTPDGSSGSPAVAINGRLIVFNSNASNLISDLNQTQHILFKDVANNSAISRVSVSTSGQIGNGASTSPSISPISPEGLYAIAFASISTNLSSVQDLTVSKDIFIRIPAKSLTEIISVGQTVNNTVTVGDQDSDSPSVTHTNGFANILVAFSSQATNLVSLDNNRSKDIFLATFKVPSSAANYNRATDLSIVKVSKSATGSDADDDSETPKLSGDGRYVIFASSATNMIAGTTTTGKQIFRYTIANGVIDLISKTSGGIMADSDCDSPVISYSGRFVAYLSKATNIISNSVANKKALILHDLVKGTITRVNADSSGVASTGDAGTATISANGRYLSFSDTGSNLVSSDLNSVADVFLKDTDTGAIARLSVGTSSEANALSDSTTVSGDSYNSLSSTTYFRSLATNLSSTASGAGDIFSRSAILLPPQLRKGTLIETPADITISGKRSILTFQDFSFPTSPLEIVNTRATSRVVFEVRIQGTGNRKKVRQNLTAKKNTITSGRLKPGVYTTRYRAVAKSGNKVVSKSGFSPRQRFEIN
jgi:hypothetical protein